MTESAHGADFCHLALVFFGPRLSSPFKKQDPNLRDIRALKRLRSIAHLDTFMISDAVINLSQDCFLGCDCFFWCGFLASQDVLVAYIHSWIWTLFAADSFRCFLSGFARKFFHSCLAATQFLSSTTVAVLPSFDPWFCKLILSNWFLGILASIPCATVTNRIIFQFIYLLS